MRTLPLVLATLALAATGCGGSDSKTTPTTTNPVASAPGATAPPTDATQPGTNPATTQTSTQPQARTKTHTTSIPQYSSTTDSGAPRTRMPANFAVQGGKLVPPGISGPAGIPIDVTVTSKDGKPHTLLIEVPPKVRTIKVAAGGRATLRIGGLRAGAYGIELDDRVAGGLIIGREPGP